MRRILPGTALTLACALSLASCGTTPTTSPSEDKPEQYSPAMERYKKNFEERLGANWYQLVKTHQDSLNVGTVKTTFQVAAAGGKARDVRVVSNTGNEPGAAMALQAIARLRAPPIPAALLAEIGKDHIDFEESFTIYER